MRPNPVLHLWAPHIIPVFSHGLRNVRVERSCHLFISRVRDLDHLRDQFGLQKSELTVQVTELDSVLLVLDFNGRFESGVLGEDHSQ